MKKTVIYITAVILIIAITVGATYAFFTASIESNKITSNSTVLDVIYSGGTHIDGKINLVSSKEKGLSTTVSIRFSQDSVQEAGDIYMDIEKITENLSIPGFKWEIYGYKNNELVYSGTGTFDGKKTSDVITLVNDYEIDYVDTLFTIYIWLDGNMVGNEVLGGEFKAYIGAKTEHFTSRLQ